VVRTSFAKFAMLALAVLPTFAALAIWAGTQLGSPAIAALPFWPVVVAELVAVLAYAFHAASNSRLPSGEALELAWQFLILIPWGMLSYWRAHIWLEGHGHGA
jgi:hypothetical protein